MKPITMIKASKSYNIKFSKGGILQYAGFNEVNGKLIRPRLLVSWCKESEIPDVSQMTHIDEVLKAIKAFSYGNRAEIYRINGQPISYYNNTTVKPYVEAFRNAYDTFIESEAMKYFEAVLLPIIKANKWKVTTSHIGFPILACKDENGEWDNLKDRDDEFDFEYLCFKFTNTYGEGKYRSANEHNIASVEAFPYFIKYIPEDYLRKNNLYLDL